LIGQKDRKTYMRKPQVKDLEQAINRRLQHAIHRGVYKKGNVKPKDAKVASEDTYLDALDPTLTQVAPGEPANSLEEIVDYSLVRKWTPEMAQIPKWTPEMAQIPKWGHEMAQIPKWTPEVAQIPKWGHETAQIPKWGSEMVMPGSDDPAQAPFDELVERLTSLEAQIERLSDHLAELKELPALLKGKK
jgi:hypothetical protein